MALTEPSPVTWTIRFKYGKKTIMLHVDPLSPFTEVKTELLRALRLTHPDGSLAHSSPIPDAPEDVTLARPVDATDYTLGWTRIRSDDADQDSDEDVPLEDLQADEGNKKPRAGKSKSKRRDFVDTTPKAAGLHDGCELAFRFRSNEKPGEDGRWNVAQLTYDDVVAPQADEDEGMVPDLEVQKWWPTRQDVWVSLLWRSRVQDVMFGPVTSNNSFRTLEQSRSVATYNSPFNSAFDSPFNLYFCWPNHPSRRRGVVTWRSMATSDGASSISVAVRVRPFTIREAAQLTKSDDGPFFLGEGSLAGAPTPQLSKKNVRPIVKVVDERCLVFDPPEDNPIQKFSRSVIPMGKRVKDQTFAFDRVFDENTTQSDVYEATTKGLLGSVMDGYNATVFAYGATGCGKTHTITGTVQQPGIIFLTMQELFERISEVQDEKVTEISLSYLEIYNETIRDLLVPGGSKQGLMLREDANQAVSVAGLSSHHPQNVEEVMDMIVRGNEYRTMSPTEANATSSRSHAVLQVNVSQKDRNADIHEPHTMATLSVIDLAGSERASATKNRGERLTEGANINKSLLALGSCINALCDPRHRNHVPYRNSKLTRLLKFSLGGNCKTVMIVCISPSSIHYDETQNTLRYANRAKNIQTKVTRNVFNVNRHVKDFLKKIDEQMGMINALKEQQKDYEGHAFAKFRKQSEKREAIVKEAVGRLRSAFEHCQGERQERINHMKKLRQIETRISMINSWIAAFDGVCETRDEEEPPRNLVAMRKSAHGILVELEGSRHHYHQRLSKSSWQRSIDTALSVGLEQLQSVEGGAETTEAATLEREAELLKANAEREFYMQVLESEKSNDSGLMQVLLTAHFETVAIINQILVMDEREAVIAAKGVLNKMITSCSDATSHLIRPDGSLPVAQAFPPTRSGTPKRTKGVSLLGPSPKKPQLAAIADASHLSASPAKGSPRRRLLGGAARRGVSFTPKKKTPSKRAVRWRDDTEDGQLAEYQKTPQQIDLTPQPAEDVSSASEVEAPPVPSMPELLPEVKEEGIDSSPIPPAPQMQSTLEVKLAPPSSQRFKAGFLARKGNDSPPAPTLSNMSSSPEPSPLSDLSASRLNGRSSLEQRGSSLKNQMQVSNEWTSGSDSEKGWAADTETFKAAMMRRTSQSRRSSTSQRTVRRASPPASSPPGAGSDTTSMAAGQARRSEFRHSVLSPRSTPISKTGNGHRRTTTMSEERMGPRGMLGGSSHVRMSSAGIVGAGASRASSVMGSASKSVWR